MWLTHKSKGEFSVEQIIEVKNIVKKFKDKTALDGLNFTVEKGEVFGFLGPSGAGQNHNNKNLNFTTFTVFG